MNEFSKLYQTFKKKYYLKTRIRKTKQMLHKTAFVSKLSKRFNLISEIS